MGGDIKLINKFLSYILRNDSNTAILDLDNPTFIIRINFDYKNACFVVNKYSYRENIIFSKYERRFWCFLLSYGFFTCVTELILICGYDAYIFIIFIFMR